MKRRFLMLVVLVGATGTWAADSFTAADFLNRWVGGQWTGEGEFVDSPYSRAAKTNAVTRCAWSPDHIFVICDQDITFGGTPIRDLSIYTFAPKTNKYYFYGISLGEEKPRSTALEIAENGSRWVYSSTNEIKGQRVQFRTINEFHGNDAVEWRTEFSTDGGKTWTKTGQGKETRQP
ncbi:MAG TPA: hypothetical protein VKV05_09775 [Terriglobales bacterium]|nr:hypothetical protein [Terriglobales bacterium]